MPKTGRPSAHASRLHVSRAARARGGARDVADAGDHGKRRLGDVGRVDGHDRIGARARERRADAAQIAGAVVGEHDLHARPFVDCTPPAAGAHASRSARPSALKPASAT